MMMTKREFLVLARTCKRGVGESTVYDTDRMESLQQRIECKLKTLRSVGVLCILFLHLPGRENCYQNIWGKYKTWTPQVVHGPPTWTSSTDWVHQNMDRVHGPPIFTTPKNFYYQQ